jgi:hypothetical protein
MCFSQSLKGKWSSPKGMAVLSFDFQSNSTFKSEFHTCMSDQYRKGKFEVRNDSIFLFYDELSETEEKLFYRGLTPIKTDTLYWIDRHCIQVNQAVMIYDSIIPSKKIPVVQAEPIVLANIIGKYRITSIEANGTVVDYKLSLSKKNAFVYTIKHNKRKTKLKGYYTVKNDTLVCSIIKLCDHQFNNVKVLLHDQIRFIFYRNNAIELVAPLERRTFYRQR